MNNDINSVSLSASAVHGRTAGSPASRDAAIHMQVIRQLVSKFDQEQDALKKALASRTDSIACRQGYRQFFDNADFIDRKKWARTLQGDSQKLIDANLKAAEALGAMRRVATAPPPSVLNCLLTDFPNFSEVTSMIQRRLALCRCAPEQLFSLPPILLDGPPGVGKTAYSKRLAKLLAIAYREIDISKGSASFAITGLDSGYSNGRPGMLWSTLNSGDGCMSCVVLLDELDKPGMSKDSHLGFLYGLLEPESAKRFQDSAILLPVDASRVAWIATCNQVERIDGPLRSRFEVLRVELPTKDEMPRVIESIHSDLFSKCDWSVAFNQKLPDSIVDALAGYSPRLIRRALEEAYANAAIADRRSLKPEDLQFRGDGCEEIVRNPIGFIHPQTTTASNI